MSRTDKDYPIWYGHGWTTYHFCREYHSRSWQRFQDRCNLPEKPPRRWDKQGRRFRVYGRGTGCHWIPDFDNVYPWCKYSYLARRARSWTKDCHLRWHGPQRAHERDLCWQAVADYRANGETEIEPEPRQHRHSMSWYW